MHQRGPALVRFALFSLIFGAFALALVQPSLAGSEAAPEVTDPSGDVDAPAAEPDLTAVPGLTEAAIFDGIDILKGYVQGSNTTVLIGLVFQGDVFTDPEEGAVYTVTFNITANGTKTAYTLTFDGAVATGPAGTAAAANGVRLNFTIPVAAVNASAGATLTDFGISTVRDTTDTFIFFPFPDRTGRDSAGPGTAYTFTAPPADDLDADGILDDCEERHFNGTAAQSNASADMDNDTLTIEQECALGTDPTKADTDGDGVRDDKDAFPTDPTKGGPSTSGSSTSGSTSSTSGTKSGSSTTSSSSGTNSNDGDVKTFADAVEKLKSDLDYLGISGGGLLVVLVLAILALSVRWSL
ncbi:MAG: hypothetical protein AABY18_07945 [Candidatus Thermoplasmatota archaeon]